MATTPPTFQTAFEHHSSGRLREAEALYRQILETDPNHFEALHLLGLSAHQLGRHGEAEKLIGRAIALCDNQSRFHSNLGEVYRVQGKLAEAERALRRALELDPKSSQAHSNLGIVLDALGRSTEAIEAYNRAICLRHDFAEPHNNLGTILQGQGKLDDAIAHYRQAVEKDTNYADAYNNLGTALKSKGKLDEAAQAYQEAVRLAPQNGDVHLNLGTVYQSQQRLEEAIDCYRQALRLNPQSVLALFNLGTVLQAQGNLEESIDHFRQALKLDPGDADIHNSLGTALKAQAMVDSAVDEDRGTQIPNQAVAQDAKSVEGYLNLGETGRDEDFSAAIASFQQALRCDPGHAKALTNLGKLAEGAGRLEEALQYYERAVAADAELGLALLYRANAHQALGRYDDAAAGYEAALRVQPDNPVAYNNLAVLFNQRSRPDEAVKCCRKGLEIKPDSGELHANLGTALGNQGRIDEGIAASRKAVELRPADAGMMSNLIYGLNRVPDYDPATLFEEHLEWARRHAEPLTARAAPHSNDPTPDRRLRIGYFSSHFRDHAVNFFTEPLITAHDHRDFEIYCYSDAKPDDITLRLQAAADQWRDVRYKSDKKLAQMVRDDGIDILVDLAGHIGGGRPLLFARKPAPVQVTYIGYQNTTGMSAMDYRLTDEQADPPGQTDRYYTEKLVRLPRAYFCYRPAESMPEVTPLPARQSGQVTFGSFNNFNKVTPQVIRAWLEILARVPNSRLTVLVSAGDDVQRRLVEMARAHGIDADRIELCRQRRRDPYFALIQAADIALDPFPFNGHTTTCDTVWLGVPTVMLLGNMYASRFGSSVLANVGLDDLIAHSVEEYIELAVGLAGDLDRLVELRAALRPRMAESALLDFPGFARNVEAAYRQMWIDWCARVKAQGS